MLGNPGAAAVPANVAGPDGLALGSGPWSAFYRAPGERARENQKEAWRKYVEPLVYPSGHPRAGEYRDGLTLQDVVNARMEYIKTLLPLEELYRPYHHIVKRVSYATVSRLSRNWNQADPVSGDAFARVIRGLSEEPEAAEQTLWIPATPSDPEATTTAKLIEQNLISVEYQAFLQPRR